MAGSTLPLSVPQSQSETIWPQKYASFYQVDKGINCTSSKYQLYNNYVKDISSNKL